MRQPSKQIQLPFNPSQHLVRRCEKSNVAQTPQISNRRSAQVAQQARMRHEEIDHENQGKRGGPCWDLVFQDREIWVDAIRFHRFVTEQEKHPHASSDRSAIEAKHDPLEECVETARQKAEGAGEQEEGDDGSMFGFEAFQEWNEGDGVQQEVEKVSMEEGVSIKAVQCVEANFLWNQRAPLGERWREQVGEVKGRQEEQHGSCRKGEAQEVVSYSPSVGDRPTSRHLRVYQTGDDK